MGVSDEDHNFHDSGPVHLKDVNWSNLDDKKTVAASLVKGAFVLDCDRQERREGTDRPLAPPWWDSFHFLLFKKLINEEDESIYGSIYELDPQQLQKFNGAPRFVIAFRGTLFKSESVVQDIISDIKIFHQCFHRRKLCESATKEVEEILTISPKVWLAGHSLGSAVAIHAGKKMAEKGVFLETFLFNPPFPALSSSTSTGKLAYFLKGSEQRFKDAESFKEVSKWLPYLYVNPDDLICKTYIRYFKKREKMADKGARHIEIWKTMNSLRAVAKNKIIRGNVDYNAFYLIPSAFLYINKNVGSQGSHALRQWWSNNPEIAENLYCFC